MPIHVGFGGDIPMSSELSHTPTNTLTMLKNNTGYIIIGDSTISQSLTGESNDHEPALTGTLMNGCYYMSFI